jgi:hypothetical protein
MIYFVLHFSLVLLSISNLFTFFVGKKRFPDVLKSMLVENRLKIICKFLIIIAINLIAIGLTCFLPTVRKYWLYVVIAYVVMIAFCAITTFTDKSLEKHFKNFVGYKEDLDYRNNNERVKSERQEIMDLFRSLEKSAQDGKNVQNEMNFKVDGFSQEKRQELERMFCMSFASVEKIENVQINSLNSKVYYFSPSAPNFGEMGSFSCLVEIGENNPRCFALELSGSTQILCEWEFKNGVQSRHRNYGALYDEGQLQDKDLYNKLIEKILEIL